MNLTEADFKLLNAALEHYPDEDLSGHIMGEMLEMALLRKSPEERERERKAKEEERKVKKQEKIDLVRAVQAKLFYLKNEILTKNEPQ